MTKDVEDIVRDADNLIDGIIDSVINTDHKTIIGSILVSKEQLRKLVEQTAKGIVYMIHLEGEEYVAGDDMPSADICADINVGIIKVFDLFKEE